MEVNQANPTRRCPSCGEWVEWIYTTFERPRDSVTKDVLLCFGCERCGAKWRFNLQDVAPVILKKGTTMAERIPGLEIEWGRLFQDGKPRFFLLRRDGQCWVSVGEVALTLAVAEEAARLFARTHSGEEVLVVQLLQSYRMPTGVVGYVHAEPGKAPGQ